VRRKRKKKIKYHGHLFSVLIVICIVFIVIGIINTITPSVEEERIKELEDNFENKPKQDIKTKDNFYINYSSGSKISGWYNEIIKNYEGVLLPPKSDAYIRWLTQTNSLAEVDIKEKPVKLIGSYLFKELEKLGYTSKDFKNLKITNKNSTIYMPLICNELVGKRYDFSEPKERAVLEAQMGIAGITTSFRQDDIQYLVLGPRGVSEALFGRLRQFEESTETIQTVKVVPKYEQSAFFPLKKITTEPLEKVVVQKIEKLHKASS